jgi:hypothetical protein
VNLDDHAYRGIINLPCRLTITVMWKTKDFPVLTVIPDIIEPI